MANRRMFSKEITNSSDFQMMSPSAQALYFHIGMNSDDDGFCEAFTIVRMTESKPDDLRALHERGFIFIVDTRVCIVRDWHTNNDIRVDRYTKSRYLDDPKYKETYTAIMQDKITHLARYRDCISYGSTTGITNGSTQVRLGKVSIGKINTMQPKTVALPDTPKKEKKNPNTKIPDWNKYLEAMDNHPARHVNIIAHYFREKGLFYETYGKVDTAIKRHLRAAKALAPFSDEEISKATDQAKSEYPDLWTVETITKLLSR